MSFCPSSEIVPLEYRYTSHCDGQLGIRRAAPSVQDTRCWEVPRPVVNTSARESLQHLGGVTVGPHVVPGALDPPVFTDEKRRSDDPHALAPV
jgi:hypothetical protein